MQRILELQHEEERDRPQRGVDDEGGPVGAHKLAGAEQGEREHRRGMASFIEEEGPQEDDPGGQRRDDRGSGPATARSFNEGIDHAAKSECRQDRAAEVKRSEVSRLTGFRVHVGPPPRR